MLYAELSDLTKGQCTFEQYEAIEKIYNDCEIITKQEAADIWRKTYGREMKRREYSRQKFEAQLITTRVLSMGERGDTIVDAIHRAENILRDKMNRYEGREYIDELGVLWTVRKWGTTPNGCYTIWTLGFLRNGEFESVRYNFF